MSDSRNFVLGVFDDEDVLLSAVRKVRGAGVKIDEVYSPFPVHGLDEELGYKRSRLPIAAFMFGILGTSLALTMQFWMLGVDWPMIIGGKDFTPLPDFIPVTFELTVLLAAFGMVGTFFVSTDLKPWKDPKMLDLRITDDKHVMAIDLGQNKSVDAQTINSVLKDSGAIEVNDKEVED
ncbi:quinol:cytochrome c oxidoreductase membrane protein [Roseivirga ehrenbergii]|uniref:Quinol:cytochrome C oxidoreductase n=3 Tax=Roseivirga TaxID=290180 RepID=A0A0L8AIU5_9BACT|nr:MULTISPECIES: DUF3341 domain-containing protein [Roseivirga]KOF02166.1 quinol:cytochrome C oxidoreductase [Roseivirga seohaensis subsp. aquiponti]KYG74344.1 quinol:cytochrome C oxidoreductase [Roseivirga ehrenbergii]KYG79792.1 quinol:cytochrome C oxidoreductase [Roseivirga seohaensis]TCL14358.1 quinol:cytochrome c oxidoreductase membrane protein [Roseivirga ehrenbergii]